MKKSAIVTALIFGFLAIGIKAQIRDDISPEVRELILTPELVDARDNSQTVTFFVRVTDEASGVSNVTLYLFPSRSDYIIPLKLERISGGANDGLYTGFKVIAAGEPFRTWTIVGITASDAAGNTRNIFGNEIVQQGFAASFQVIGNSTAPPFVKNRKRVRFFNPQSASAK